MRGWSSAAAAWILFAAAAGAPLPFGSASPSAIAFWCIVLGAGLVLATPREFDRRHVALVGVAALIVAGYALVLHEQLSDTPWFALPHPLWREASDALGVALVPDAPSVCGTPCHTRNSPPTTQIGSST